MDKVKAGPKKMTPKNGRVAADEPRQADLSKLEDVQALIAQYESQNREMEARINFNNGQLQVLRELASKLSGDIE